MKKRLLLAAAALLPFTAFASIDADMRSWGEILIQDGFAKAPIQDMSGRLAADDDRSYEVRLQKGKTYAFVGACGAACSDLDLAVLDKDDSILEDDIESDTVPVVFFRPEANETYRVKVSVYECAASACAYRVGVYTKAESDAVVNRRIMQRKVEHRR